MRSTLDEKPQTTGLKTQTATGVCPDGRFGPLVEAALRPEAAVEAWDTYRQQLGSDTPNEGETRLYPMIAANLKGQGIEKLDPALLAAQRRALALSSICLHAADHVNDVFTRHGIPIVFSKGLALQITEYRNPLLRTFSDIDCCIRVEDIAAVVQLAADEGWHNPKNLIPQTQQVVEAHVEMTFQLPSGVALDIHWVPRRPFTFQPKLINQFFETTEMVEWRGRTWRVPSATWRLIETIEHGVESNKFAPIRWVTDAVQILENPANVIDWHEFADAARKVRLRVLFLAALTRLAEISDKVPDVELARFKGPAAPLQALEFRARLNQRPSLRQRLKREVLHYMLRAPGSVALRVAHLPAFLIQGAGRSPRTVDFLGRLWRHRNAK